MGSTSLFLRKEQGQSGRLGGKWIKCLVAVQLCSLFLGGSVYAEAATPIPIKLDHRGLVTIDGLLRGNSESHWGAHNLVVQPKWGWAAQDYCLKNVKKTGSTYTADFKTKPPLKMVQENKRRKADGKEWLQVSYSLKTPDGKAATYDRVFVFFPFASKDFIGGRVTLDDGTEVPLPADPAGKIPFPHETESLTISNGQQSFTVASKSLRISLHDLRPKTTAFQIQLDYPEPKNKTSMAFDFEVSAEAAPSEIEADGRIWVKMPCEREIKTGSILDFSALAGPPAGTHGRIINKNGHFAYEKTGERVRLIGTNLCYTANYLEKAEADRIAAHFRKMGYNAVRFHHTDVHLRKGNWNSHRSDDIDPAYLDRLDYLFQAMKQAGMYVTIDLYTQRRFGKGEIPGVDKEVEGEIKGLIPIHEPAFEAWKKLVVKWMNHVNPYTGLAWKDDPALAFICPVNEDSIASAWGGVAKPFYLKRFAEWKKARGTASKSGDLSKDPLFAEFLIEVKTTSNRKIEMFLRELGVKAMISGSNWWNTMAQTFMRAQLDVVDNHGYSDHPQPWRLPSSYNQVSNLDQSHAYMMPGIMFPTRVFGKPFTVTEYNYCMPNQWRAEGGAFMGAYAALQDWDALFRFAWAHDAKRVNAVNYMYGFDMSSDPLTQLTERQVVLFFRRGDVAPARWRYVYGVTRRDATREGHGDMWRKGLFPRSFTALGFVSQVGSQVIDGDQGIKGEFAAVVTADSSTGGSALAGNRHMVASSLPKQGKTVLSDTNQVVLDTDKDTLRIQSPQSECIVAKAGRNLTSGNLAIASGSTFCSVSASAMDGKPLASSERILLLHLTNVLNTKMKFTSLDMTTLTAYGELPYIVRAGRVDVSLRNDNPSLHLYVCDLSGQRLREVSTRYVDGAYMFPATISAESPNMVYELVVE